MTKRSTRGKLIFFSHSRNKSHLYSCRLVSDGQFGPGFSPKKEWLEKHTFQDLQIIISHLHRCCSCFCVTICIHLCVGTITDVLETFQETTLQLYNFIHNYLQDRELQTTTVEENCFIAEGQSNTAMPGATPGL